MNPRNRKPLNLAPDRAALFEAHLWLVGAEASRLRAWCPPLWRDDLLQAGRMALARLAREWDGAGSFGALGRVKVRSGLRAFLFGRRRLGLAALKDAESFELPAEDPIGSEDGETVTRGDKAERKLARIALTSGPAADHLAARFHSLRSAIWLPMGSPGALTDLERDVVRFRYMEEMGLREVCRALRVSPSTVKRATASALAKLRQSVEP